MVICSTLAKAPTGLSTPNRSARWGVVADDNARTHHLDAFIANLLKGSTSEPKIENLLQISIIDSSAFLYYRDNVGKHIIRKRPFHYIFACHGNHLSGRSGFDMRQVTMSGRPILNLRNGLKQTVLRSASSGKSIMSPLAPMVNSWLYPIEDISGMQFQGSSMSTSRRC